MDRIINRKRITVFFVIVLSILLAFTQVPWVAYADGEDVESSMLAQIDETNLQDGEDQVVVEDDLDSEKGLIDQDVTESEEGSTLVTQAGDIASGTLGDCVWVIDADGVLSITPGTGNSFHANWSHLGNDAPWHDHASEIKAVELPDRIVASGSLAFMFGFCSSLTSVDLSNLDTSAVTDMGSMFNGCSALTSLDLSGFDTASVTDMGLMFRDCSALTSLDLSSFDTAAVVDAQEMFFGCSSLTSLVVSSFDTSSVVNMGEMFRNCSKLTTLDVSGFDTSSATNMQWMFRGCSSISSLDLSGFDTSTVTNMNSLLGGCSMLKTVKLGAKFSFKGANGLNGAVLTTLPTGSWLSESVDKNKVYTADAIAEDRNDLADTYRKVALVKSVKLTGVQAPVAGTAVTPIDAKLEASAGMLSSSAVKASWNGSFAKDANGNDVFVAGNTYTFTVDVALGSDVVRDDGFVLAAGDGFTVTPGAFSGAPVGPTGQSYSFTVSYTVPTPQSPADSPAGDGTTADNGAAGSDSTDTAMDPATEPDQDSVDSAAGVLPAMGDSMLMIASLVFLAIAILAVQRASHRRKTLARAKHVR